MEIRSYKSVCYSFSFRIATKDIGTIEQILEDNDFKTTSTSYTIERGVFMRDKSSVTMEIRPYASISESSMKHKNIIAFAQKMGATQLAITHKESLNFEQPKV